MSLELLPGVPLDESRYGYLSWILRSQGSPLAFESPPTAVELLAMLEYLLAGLAATGPEGAAAIWASWE